MEKKIFDEINDPIDQLEKKIDQQTLKKIKDNSKEFINNILKTI